MRQHRHIRQFKELLPKVIEKLLPSPPESGKWGEQRWYEGAEDVDYFIHHRLIYNKDWLNHFLQKPRHEEDKYGRKYRIGSLACQLADKFDQVKSFGFDADNPQAVEAVNTKLLPKLAEYNIESIYEYGGWKLERRHVWFFCNTSLSVLKAFVEQLLEEAGIDWQQLKLELFPTHKPNNMMRLPGGHHLRANAANPITFRGKTGNDPIFVMQSIIDCKAISEEEILRSLKKPINLEQTVPLKEHKTLMPQLRRSSIKKSNPKRKKHYVYEALNLPLDFNNVA
jgi:hypothetical protein